MSDSLRTSPGGPRSAPPAADGGRGPVVLATLAVPFEPESASVAFQAALETGARLIVVDVVEMPLWPLALSVGHADLELDEDRAEIRRLVGHAAALGIEVEHLRVRSPRPVRALLDVVVERSASLLVFGPDPRRLRPRLFARIVRRVRRKVACLLWVAGEGP